MDSASTLAAAKAEVFGAEPALGTDGQPLERGVGSVWHRAEQIQKAHFYSAMTWASCDELVAMAKQLLAIAEKIRDAAKSGAECAAAAKAEVPAVAVQVPAVVPKPIMPPEPVTLSFDIPPEEK